MRTYAVANAIPRDSKAMGSDEDITKLASMIARRRNRTGNFSGSSQFVTHDVKIQTHHTASMRRRVSTAPAGVKCSINKWESCVTAKTNTRSKNSSIKVTLL